MFDKSAGPHWPKYREWLRLSGRAARYALSKPSNMITALGQPRVRYEPRRAPKAWSGKRVILGGSGKAAVAQRATITVPV